MHSTAVIRKDVSEQVCVVCVLCVCVLCVCCVCVVCVLCVCGTSEKMKNFYPLISLLCLFDSLTLHDLSSNFNFI